MKLQFLGTGAAEGAPAIFCKCDTCQELRRRGEKEYHTRAQFLIDDVVGIEFPPDAYYHALRFDVDLTKMKYLLVTHSHMDHFYAHDFILRGYKYTSEHEESVGMGTTLVLAILTKEFLLFGNIGDSSGYVLKNEKIHKNHSLPICVADHRGKYGFLLKSPRA